MNYSPEKRLEILAHEAFIRRAAQVDMPFMLKGSYVTRQYLSNPKDRIPNDLDWVYLEHLNNVDDAHFVFGAWATAVTELELEDGVTFKSFAENAFWRMIDYAMDDDFPTVNTDLVCYVDGEEYNYFGLDISFNLFIEEAPEPIWYLPLRGEPFYLANSTPLSLQLAWKLHQTIIRPRDKDIFDLMCLLKHPNFDEAEKRKVAQILANECHADRTNPDNLLWFITDKAEQFHSLMELHRKDTAEFKALKKEQFSPYELELNYGEYTSSPKENLPEKLSGFLRAFRHCLVEKGIDEQFIKNLPKPNRYKK